MSSQTQKEHLHRLRLKLNDLLTTVIDDMPQAAEVLLADMVLRGGSLRLVVDSGLRTHLHGAIMHRSGAEVTGLFDIPIDLPLFPSKEKGH